MEYCNRSRFGNGVCLVCFSSMALALTRGKRRAGRTDAGAGAGECRSKRVPEREKREGGMERGVDFLTVGFWNIEKHNVVRPDPDNPNGYVMSESVAFIIETIQRWYLSSDFDVIILAEVTESKGAGDLFAHVVANRLNGLGGHQQTAAFNASFNWFPTAADRVGVCNYICIWNEAIPCLSGLGGRIRFVWNPDHTRPMIMLNAGIMRIGGLHAKAVIRDQATTEIIEACFELGRHDQPAALIGDMNIPFGKMDVTDENTLNSAGWEAVAPGFAPTHVTRARDENKEYQMGRSSVLDYLWRNGGISQCIAVSPMRGFQYQFWEVNDHAPICYKLCRTARDVRSGSTVPRRAPVPA